jgi:tight adherence protein B
LLLYDGKESTIPGRSVVKQDNRRKEEAFCPEDYSIYRYEWREWLLYAGIGAGVMGVVGWVFYRSWLIVFLAFCLGLLYPGFNRKALVEKRRNVLRVQFKDLLYYLGSSLSAGKSVEQSFVQVYTILKGLYPGKKSDIVLETELILRRLQMNENIESILKDFAVRSGIEEIHHFADVFSVCKRTGGNLVEVIRTTVAMISERIEMKQEIETGLAAKKQEQRILSLSPIAMVIFISTMSGEFMEPLFTTPAGRVVMTISLCLVGFGLFLSNRIMKIRF